MSDIHLPSRWEFVHEQLAASGYVGFHALEDVARVEHLGEPSMWTPVPTDTGVMHGPSSQWLDEISGGVRSTTAHRVPGTTRTV